ncbi:MAG: AmmeMemoRadiSam system radical SAM enzyme [Bacteroidales bacterium]|nr:AmmeMemoRadiSam system radical SAM enzyme [Bacteroidales bacterium]
MIKEAQYYKKLDSQKVQCLLCPHNCIININKFGKCRVRKNIDGKLISENYAVISSFHSDPIEKKPLYHFYPGKNILSIGSVGCNLKCKFCQNSSISQSSVEEFKHAKIIYPEIIIKEAKRTRNNIGIAYTYNEPIVWYEFMLETAKKAKDEKMKNVVVTNGYINEEPLNELIPYIDAFNIDLKAFTEDFYKKQTNSSLAPVLKNIEIIKNNNKHIEITNLIIPGLNDDKHIFEDMIKKIVSISGKNTVTHLSRYFPSYKMTLNATGKSKMNELFDIAKKHLNYVYLGNIITDRGQNTYCPECNNKVISRTMYYTQINGMSNQRCLNCKTEIPIIS